MVYARNQYISEHLQHYVAEHSSGLDDLVGELRVVTQARAGDEVRMQIGDDQAVFFEMLTRATGAERILEIGTFTGTSALAFARGLGPKGHLVCLDVSEEWTSIARDFWARAGVDDRIELRLGPAIETLKTMSGEQFDLIFIDADKPSYLGYYEATVPMLSPNGLLLADNTLQDGLVADAHDNSENTVALREFNDRVVSDDRVRCVLLPVADGVMVVQRR